MTEHIELDRKFWPAEMDEENSPESVRAMLALGVDGQISWADLLKKPRVVIIAEPGTGKTEELRSIADRMRNDGKSAFFCRIELLQDLDVRNSFDIGTSAEFNKWLSGDQEGYFFLDSVDEARLRSRSAFEIALRRFAEAIGDACNRTKIVVSCRVSVWRATADLLLFVTHLPKPPKEEVVALQQDESYPDENARQLYKAAVPDDGSTVSEEKKDHVVFRLAPLDEPQIRRFASVKGVTNTSEFIEAIKRADAMIFAERPQDLLDLIAFWKSNGRLGRHIEMLEFNIRKKLDEHDTARDKERPLSSDDAFFGAERLAAAATLQKKNAIILPDQPIDADLREASIESKNVFPDWPSDKIQTLLDRAIFDEAIYGTVRFHHQSVREYLTAKWLNRLLCEGKSRRSIEGMFFATRYGCDVVIPSMRPIVAWLALWDERVRNQLRKIAPEVLIENGDPSALPVEFRKALLISFAELYAESQYTGTSFDITMIRRLADPGLSSTVNDLLKQYAKHNDVCILLLKLIWQGQISASTDIALSYAIDHRANSYIRACAIRAVAAAGSFEQKHNLVNKLFADISESESSVNSEIIDAFFPNNLSAEQLLEIMKTADTPEKYSVSDLQHSIDTISKEPLSDEMTEKMLRGLHGLLKTSPFIERRHCEISKRYAWVLPTAIRLANQFIKKKHPFSLNPIVLDLLLGFFSSEDYHYFDASEREGLLKDAKIWPEFRLQIFWHSVAAARAREIDKEKHFSTWWHVRWDIRDFWVPNVDDLDQLFMALNHKPTMDDRLIALTAIFTVYINEKRPRNLRERMKQICAETPELQARLQELLHPKPLSAEERKLRRRESDLERRQEVDKKRQEANRQEWVRALKRKPAEIKNVGNAQEGQILSRTAYLYDRMREKKDVSGHRLGKENWRVLIDEFGYDIAKNFRDGCVAYWRAYDPFLYSNWRTDNSIPWPRIIGLTGLAMEAFDNPEWAKYISREEAVIASHYSVCELNGFPSWLIDLHNEFPDVIDDTIKVELQWELSEGPMEKRYPHTLSALRHGDEEFRRRFKSVLFDLLFGEEPLNDQVLDYALSLILEDYPDGVLKEKMSALAIERFKTTTINNHKFVWLVALLCVDGVRGTKMLKDWINDLPSAEEQKETVINFCAALTDHGDARFGRTVRDYEKVVVLSELVPYIFSFVKREEDVTRKGAYSPDSRDLAERTRSHLLSVIYDTPGRLSYEALVNFSEGLGNGYFRDRLQYLAKERAALDAEFQPWTGSDIASFALSAERQPKTEADLYELALVRLDELRTDIEDGDESEAELLQKLTEETKVRVIFANRLRKSSRSHYTVGSEEELADATRTDIRLNAPQISAPVPIELKIADKWSVTELIERLEHQLIGQYMRISQYGIFLVVYNGQSKYWIAPVTKKHLSFAELIKTLKKESIDLTKKYPQVAALEVVAIDFTMRKCHKTKCLGISADGRAIL